MGAPGPHGRHVGYANADLIWAPPPVDDGIVNRCHAIAVVDDPGAPVALTPQTRILVCESVQGWRFLPGGTREPDESVTDLVARELREEAGAEVRGPIRLAGGWRAESHNATPYRPHLTHPSSIWGMALVAAERVAAPTCPPGGEQIIAVHTLAVVDAIRWLNDSVDDLHAVALTALLENS